MAKMTYLDTLRNEGLMPFLSEEGLDAIRSFEPKVHYTMTEKNKPVFKSHRQRQIEVGKNVSLIRDMVWYEATVEELVRAIKHGMVVFDAEKYFLDWMCSAKDFGIDELFGKYRRFNRRPNLSERERLVIAAYTGYVIDGDDGDKIIPFIEKTLGHTIGTPEPPQVPVVVEIHRAFKNEFCEICRRHHIFNI